MATPFRKSREGDGTATYSDVQKIHQQLNFTNTAISTLGGQLKALNLDSASTSCLDKTCVQNINTTSENEESEVDDEESLNDLEQNFE